MALRAAAARARSAVLHLAAPGTARFSPPATIGSPPAAPRPFLSKSTVISMGIPAPSGSALLLSHAFASPAITGRSLISTAHGQQARYYSTGALVIGEETVKVLVTEVGKCSSVAGDCLVVIETVKELQVVTLVVILTAITSACYVGQQVIDRGSEIVGQLKKHAPEILGEVCDEFLYQMKIPFVGSGRRLVFKDHWFNNPEKALSRREQRKRRH